MGVHDYKIGTYLNAMQYRTGRQLGSPAGQSTGNKSQPLKPENLPQTAEVEKTKPESDAKIRTRISDMDSIGKLMDYKV